MSVRVVRVDREDSFQGGDRFARVTEIRQYDAQFVPGVRIRAVQLNNLIVSLDGLLLSAHGAEDVAEVEANRRIRAARQKCLLVCLDRFVEACTFFIPPALVEQLLGGGRWLREADVGRLRTSSKSKCRWPDASARPSSRRTSN